MFLLWALLVFLFFWMTSVHSHLGHSRKCQLGIRYNSSIFCFVLVRRISRVIIIVIAVLMLLVTVVTCVMILIGFADGN